MSLNKNKNIHEPSLDLRLLQKSRALLYKSPLYLMTLKRRKSLEFVSLPESLYGGSEEIGHHIFQDQFPFAGRSYQCPDTPWSVAQDDQAWQIWVHGYEWLDDLLNLQEPQHIDKAKYFIENWLDLHGVWSPLAWRADVIGNRVVSWVKHSDKICNSASETFSETFIKSLSSQASHLSRSYFRDLKGLSLLIALRGQLYVSLFIKGFEKNTEKVLDRLAGEFDSQILADGGHSSRSPAHLVKALELCLEISQVLKQQKIETPDKMSRAIDRMAPMLRTMRHGDGCLALFHGSQEGRSNHIEALLEATGNLGQALSDARHSGYQRIEAAHSTVIMDVAAPIDQTLHDSGHAAPLSFEFSYEQERVLVNCGAVLGGDPTWQEALAASAAHNTLTVDDTNCMQFVRGSGIVSRPISVSHKRFEENGQVLIDASHDAYRESLGLIHHRSLYINKTGDDLRVEDTLKGAGGHTYVISLHLHPDVDASLVQDGKAALLKLPSGIGWHLRVQGGKLEMRESIYAGNPGELRHTDQIVIQGPLRGEGATVKWRLSKIGGF